MEGESGVASRAAVPAPDEAALADCLREARLLPVTRLLEMGWQARADVEAATHLDHVVGRMLALYQGAHPREPRKTN